MSIGQQSAGGGKLDSQQLEDHEQDAAHNGILWYFSGPSARIWVNALKAHGAAGEGGFSPDWVTPLQWVNDGGKVGG